MKGITATLSLIMFFLFANTLFAKGSYLFDASVHVYNHTGGPQAGMPVKLWLTVIDPQDRSHFYEYIRNTDSGGYVWLYCLVPPEHYEFLEWMAVSIQNPDYSIISSQNAQTQSGFHLDPVLNVGLDVNDNQVVDVWEMALAKKFCPVLFAPKEDRGYLFGGGTTTLRPVPVEIMDRDGPNGQPDGILTYHDVEVSVYNVAGQLVGIYDMEDLTVFGTPYSNRYPDVILPYEQRNIDPPGAPAYASYVLVPQFEWVTSNVPEQNSAWYAYWEQKMSAQATNTWYKHGTTYVGFDKNGNNTRINYMFHYPFNASAGRHEGDWPTIRVTLSSQNPSNASIVSVSYPIHGIGSLRTIKVNYSQSLAQSFAGETFWDAGNGNPVFANKYFAIGQTHPVSFGGGYLEYDGIWGYGSHAQYPCPGIWRRYLYLLNERVVENGSIPNETVQFSFNNYQNIKLIPPRHIVINQYRNDPNYNWLVFGGLWGHWNSLPTALDDNLIVDLLDFITEIWNLVPFAPDLEIPLENVAPFSPYKGSLQP